MPQVQVKVTGSEKVWSSPDGQRTIHKVTLDHDGQELTAKTFSDAIAVVGWSGTVMTEDRPTKSGGTETFVKQPPKEGGYQNRTSSPQGSWSGGTKDNYTMYLSYAKDIAVAMLKDGKLDENAFGEVLAAVNAGGKTLYEYRVDAEKPEETPEKTELDKVFDDLETIPEDSPWNKL